METATICNNTPRKQLSEQLDRLDAILDALSEGLNSAVADAAREGTRLAVKDAVISIMTDVNLRAQLHLATAPEPPAEPTRKPGFWARLKAKAGQAGKAVSRMATHIGEGSARAARTAVAAAGQAVGVIQELGSLRTLALVGLGVGTTMGLLSSLAPHAVSAAVAAVNGAVAAVAVQLGVWTRRAWRAFRMA
jgi:hypothetical protein